MSRDLGDGWVFLSPRPPRELVGVGAVGGDVGYAGRGSAVLDQAPGRRGVGELGLGGWWGQ